MSNDHFIGDYEVTIKSNVRSDCVTPVHSKGIGWLGMGDWDWQLKCLECNLGIWWICFRNKLFQWIDHWE